VNIPNPYRPEPAPQKYVARRATETEASAARRVAGVADGLPVWLIEGPYMAHYFVGVQESCGPQMERALNLAYLAGQRSRNENGDPAAEPSPRQNSSLAQDAQRSNL